MAFRLRLRVFSVSLGVNVNSTEERNQQIKDLLDDLYTKATDEQYTIDEKIYKEAIDKLFDTKAWGFREIVLVVIIGMMLDPKYQASNGLYNCSPRAIYEGPIKDFLIEKEIPHRKSGPLNVAKATVGLDDTWAAQRRPADIAKMVVVIINYMERNRKQVVSVGISLMRRLIALRKHLKSLSVTLEPSSNPDFLYNLCFHLIKEAPDSGNTPQKIVAFLLKNYHVSMNTGVVVTGEEDRASVTSTTSKKPGDVNEESTSGIIYKVYEVTVKPFNLARIIDSHDCVQVYNKSVGTNLNEIIVICRPEDCPTEMKASGLHEYLGSYEYQNIVYYYWNIYEWISSTLQRMTHNGKIGFYRDLNNYINHINTAEEVKTVWKGLLTEY